MPYYLGADIGGTKTHVVIANDHGQVIGLGKAGAGNPQGIGYEAMFQTLSQAAQAALTQAQVTIMDVAGAGFGIAGYDWPSDKAPMQAALERLGLACPFHFVNDAVPGIVAGTREGWGVSVVSGTGCNCRGWDRSHQREGRVTGYGAFMGEGAGASELIIHCMQIVSYSWSKRLPPTSLSDAFIKYAGAQDIDDLIEGYTKGTYEIGAEAAPLIFEVAERGDALAIAAIRWAGEELGEMANAVIRQLEFEALDFEVVMVGGMFKAGGLLIESMRTKIHTIAPGSQLTLLTVPPVIGAVMIGMEQAGRPPTPEVHQTLISSFPKQP